MKERIKTIRTSLTAVDGGKMTQERFAEALGVSKSAIVAYETGNRTPNSAFISLLCSKYNINATWLETGDGEMYKQDAEDVEAAELMKLLSSSIVDNSIKLKLSKLLLHVINDMDDAALDMIKNMILDLADEIKKN